MTPPHETVLIHRNPDDVIDDSVNVIYNETLRRILEANHVVLPVKIPKGLRPYVTDNDPRIVNEE